MFGRSAKWTSVLFLALCVVLLTAGCFGGGGGSDTTGKTATTDVGGGSTGGTGPEEGETLQAVDGAPTDFVAALENRPIVILFYIPGNADDTAVLDSVNRLRTSFDSYAFLLYDYKDPDAYGTLAQQLNVDYTPFLALVDGAGVLQKRFVGYVDEGTLNQTLVNLGR
jgi:hypothetical protein